MRVVSLALVSGWTACWLAVGCASLQPAAHPPELPPLPGKKQLRRGPYVFFSDSDLTRREHAALLKELEQLPEQIYRELQLPDCTNVISVYLFADRQKFEQYMQAHFKDLPNRRAFFMAVRDERRGNELAVYTYWGDRIREDLRHELCHALLHGVLKDVPMWLDEGLAEYFEVPADLHGLNYRHLSALRSCLAGDWTPDLARLERITEVKQMTPADYREAWAWTHMMLQGSPEVRNVLLNYLQELRHHPDPGPFAPRLEAVVSNPASLLKQHLSVLDSKTRTLGASP
jgi:hypothetical protein